MKLAIFLMISPACIVLAIATLALVLAASPFIYGMGLAWMLSHPEPQEP